MPLSDKDRISKDQSKPRIVTLWNALTALRSVVSFMNTGAHPDDETSAMLAALRFRDGIDISYACSTRGEGGQNDIGNETTEALGVLRTAEMEAACDLLDLRMYWLSDSPDDTIFDFGFSKSGEETLEKWGRKRVLERFVHIIRRERPDIICPTFLDVPGQHGHHRAMTEAALVAFDLAADPDFQGCHLPVWEVKKLYLPAWSGAGQAYDDDLPPPPATVTVTASDSDSATGWSYARIGQQSRAHHATQAMGRWIKRGDEIDFPLHLARTRVIGPDMDICSGLPATLTDLRAPEASEHLEEAQESIDAAIAAFPVYSTTVVHAAHALEAIRQATSALKPQNKLAFAHKLVRKEKQLSNVIRIASRIDIRARFDKDVLRPLETAEIDFDMALGTADVKICPELPDGWSIKNDTVSIGETAAPSNPYPDSYFPGEPAAPCLIVAVTTDGIASKTRTPFETTPVVTSAQSATLAPIEDVINIANEARAVSVRIDAPRLLHSDLTLTAPSGWQVRRTESTFKIEAPRNVKPGLYTLALKIDGADVKSVQHIRGQGLSPRALERPAEVRVRVVDAALPPVCVGYFGGGNDRVCHWLARLGAKITDLSDADISDTTLAKFDTIVIGIFAMKFCAGLSDLMPRLHAWTREGGTLITLYHRPWDNWDPELTPPNRIELGQPSLRWRVTDENAEVDLLEPDHPLFHSPNKLGEEDWIGWHKERGLYFAKDWDNTYKPLISMHDPGEKPLNGAWLVADVGEGRHIHTSLILHHQMEKLTPGAFRIMANLLARRS